MRRRVPARRRTPTFPYPLLANADVRGKRVILRAGFDVPIENGKVTDTERIAAILPTMRAILDRGASLVILAHQGRPKGKAVPAFSQKPLVPVLRRLLRRPIVFAPQLRGTMLRRSAAALKPGEVLLVENLRYHPGEESNDLAFARELAALGDLYVNDAFTNCHRSHASMVGLPKLLPHYMGLTLEQEVRHLSRAIEDPRHPVVLIVSGAKMETKIPVIERFLDAGDDILLGGAIANTFIAARGFDIGRSKCEESLVEKAQELMLEADKVELANIVIPRDAVVATAPREDAAKLDLPLEDIEGDMCIFDIGKVTIARYTRIIAKAGTIIWNGPVGMYEYNRFSHGTKRIAEAIVTATAKGAFSVIGGGDTIDFHRRYRRSLRAYSFVSTGGGAMLEFVSGKPLPALRALTR